MPLRRNKSKYEYTLQGWKAFALSHSVRSGDRLQIELLPDGCRVRADIVKRASPKERAGADAGPASPAVVDVASMGRPSSGVTSCERHPWGHDLPATLRTGRGYAVTLLKHISLRWIGTFHTKPALRIRI